jgi:6-pyruvoyltetrahydropterin/6-carboxytetrahydropterin synthase
VRAYVRCEKLNDLGIGIDFKEVRRLLSLVVENLDHKDLNSIFNTQEFNPSSENIARYIYNELEKCLNEPQCKISRVDVYETPGNCTSYFEHD